MAWFESPLLIRSGICCHSYKSDYPQSTVVITNATKDAKQKLMAKTVAGVHFRYVFGCDPNRPCLEARNITKEVNDAWSLLMWSRQIRNLYPCPSLRELPLRKLPAAMFGADDDIHRRAGQPMEMDWRSTQDLKIISWSRKNILRKLRHACVVSVGENVGCNASLCCGAG